jgi:hypothetical protein
MPAECYELVISGVLAGQFVQNVMHVNVDNSSSVNPYAIAEDVLETLNNTVQFFAAWCEALPGDYRITSVRCRRVLGTGGPTAISLGAVLDQSVGQRAGSIQAAQVNPVLIFLTTLRPNRPGKVFLPGLSETDCDDMTYTAGIVAAFTALIDKVVTGFTLDNNSFAASFGVRRRGTGLSDDISAGRISPLIGTQRRRLRPV